MGLYKRGRVYWMRFTYRGKHYRESTETMDKKEAQRIYDAIKGQIAENKWIDGSKEREISFKRLMDEYMEEHSRLKKESWRRDEVSLSHLEPFFGDYVLAEITPALISRYKSQRLREGAKPATLNRELSLMKHAFNLAVKEWEWCRENPCCRVKMERENNERNRVLGYDEEERLLEACPQWLREIIIFALDTGAREGEILTLNVKSIDPFRRVVTILQEKTGQYKTIPVTSRLMEILKNKIEVRHLRHDLVFPSEDGTKITASNLGRAFRKALKKATIEDFKFHDLRHSYASRLAQSGIDPYTIQRLLGHKDPKMVQRYAHHSVESLRIAVGALEKMKSKCIEEKLAQI
jgi:integrase